MGFEPTTLLDLVGSRVKCGYMTKEREREGERERERDGKEARKTTKEQTKRTRFRLKVPRPFTSFVSR